MSSTLPTHLNSPLSTTLLKESLGNLRNNKLPRNSRVQFMQEEIMDLLSCSKISSTYPFEHDIQHLNSFFMHSAVSSQIEQKTISQFRKYWGGLLSFVPAELMKLENGLSKATLRKKLNSVESDKDFPTTLSLFNLRVFLEEGVCLTSKSKKTHSEETMQMYPRWKPVMKESGELVGFHGKFIDTKFPFEVKVSSDIALITIYGKDYLTTRNHFLLVSDLISQRFIILLTSILAKYLKRSNYPDFDDFWLLFSMGDSLLKTYKNNSFNSLSLWEPIIIGEVLKREPDIAVDESEFFQKIKTEFINSQGTAECINMASFFEKIVEPWIGGIPINQLFQLFGLYRIWGHPTINEEEGVKKLKSIACKPRMINHDVIDVMVCKWREYFCMNYYAANRRWPSLTINERAPNSALLRALRDGIEINRLHPGYKMSHWKHIKFNQTFEVPEKFELSEMIADKATSFSWSQLAESCKSHGNIGPAWKRNVIIQWLETNYNNPLEFLTKIDDKGFDPDERCVGVHPKERELKIFCRLFGLLTIEKRLYVVITEAMLADHVFQYFPEITMTFDAVTLNTRIHHNTIKLARSRPGFNRSLDYHTVVVNMDFNKWNSYMRKEETLQLFQDFDHLFGFKNVYTRTHEMFSNSMMYLADGTITPLDKEGKPIDSECVWFDHLGGIEGLRQKGWTIFTVVLLKYISETHQVQCQIMGQGDNQVLILDYPLLDDLESVKIRHKRFIEDMNKFLSYIGPPLKLEETWSSSNFFIYGKFPVYKGKPMSMSIKKLCRTMRLTNENFQSLESTLSSITANASSATASDYDPTIPYIIGMFETLGAIDLHLSFPFYLKKPFQVRDINQFQIPADGLVYKHKFSIHKDLVKMINNYDSLSLVSLALLPCSLGGFPSLHLCDLMNHGFPDPVGLNIWGLQRLIIDLECDNPPLKRILTRQLSILPNPFINVEMLCQDPVSLNLLKSSSGGEKFKRMVFEFLTNDIKANNQTFLTFLKIAKERQTDLSKILGTMNPMNPRVANSILASTIVGRAMKIVSKVNNTGTLINLMDRFRSADITRNLEKNLMNELGCEGGRLGMKHLSELFGTFELNYVMSVMMHAFGNRLTAIPEIPFCSTSYAQKLREDTWQLNITGVSVAVPQELLSWNLSNGGPCQMQSHPNKEAGFIKVTTHLSRNLLDQPNFTFMDIPPGPFKPFFGSKTRNKVSYEGGELKKVAPPMMRQVLDSLCLIGWGTDYNSNLSKLLQTIFSSFTDLDPLLCIPETSRISGSVEHRWDDMRTSHSSSLSILYEPSTHITVSTNTFEPHLILPIVTSDNVNINYQAIFTWISSVWSSLLLNNPTYISQCYHLHIKCKECTKSIYEGMLEIEDPSLVMDGIKSSVDQNNPYCWIPKEKLIPGLISNSPELNIRSQADESCKNLNDILSLLTADYYLGEFPLIVSDQYINFKILESSIVIPINVALTLDLRSFIRDIQGLRMTHYIYVRSLSLSKRSHLNGKVLLKEIIDTLSDVPSLWYKGMVSLLLNYEGLNELRKFYPALVLPKGTPPSLEEKCRFFYDLFKIISAEFNSTLSYIKWLDTKLISFSILSKSLIFNPIIISIIKDCFRIENPDIDLNFNILSKIRELSFESRTEILLHSNSNLYDVFKSPMVIVADYVIRELIHHILLIKNNVVPCYTNSMDNVTKLIAKRKKMSEVTDMSKCIDHYSNINIQLHHLPNACIRVWTDSGLLESSIIRNKTLPITLLEESERSYFNHFLKIKNPITTAAYKLLSILALHKSYLGHHLDNDDIIGCFGDGIGGYSTTCGRLFPDNKIFYNTLFEFDKLSSVGVDNYIPAALGMVPSIMKRVLGLEMTSEKISDLTAIEMPDLISSMYNRFGLIISDAEGGGWSNPLKGLMMSQNLSRLSHSTQGKIIIIKSYASRIDMLYAQYIILKHYFMKVEVDRSLFSSIGNTEVFLVAYDKFNDCRPPHLSVVQGEVDNSVKIHIIQTFVSVPSLSTFEKIIKTGNWREQDASEVHIPYSDALVLTEWYESEISLLHDWISSLRGTEEFVIFPTDLVYSWRREYNLVKFTEGDLSRFKVNFLTNSVMTKIIYEYFLIKSLKVKTKEEIEDWINSINLGYFVFFGSIDGFWSVNWSSDDSNIGPNSKTVRISDHINGPKLKELCVNAGRLSQDPPSITILDITNSLVTPSVPYCYEIDFWWREIGKRSYPLSMTPSPRYVIDKLTGKKRYSPIKLTIPLFISDRSVNFTTQDARLDLDLLQNQEILEFERGKKKYFFKRSNIRVILTKERLKLRKILKELNKSILS